MFEQTLLDRQNNPVWNNDSHRGLATLTSLSLQALAVGALLLLPLLRPQGLPSFRQLSPPVSIGQPLPVGDVGRPHANINNPPSEHAIFLLTQPSRIPAGLPAAGVDGPPQLESGTYIPGAPGSGSSDGMPNAMEVGTRPIMPVAPPAVHPVRISHMSEGNLVRKVLPGYPRLARSARIQGVVVLQALISREGAIENLRLLSGHPMLASAAIEAVSQWRYRPYILNNEAVEVETQITVNFSLNGN